TDKNPTEENTGQDVTPKDISQEKEDKITPWKPGSDKKCLKYSVYIYITIYILCYINFLNFTFAQRSPTISYITQTQIKDIGGTVELSCSVQYTADYSVIWMKVDKLQNSNSLPISTGSSLILHDSRFSLRYDPSSSTYLLQIKDIQETDAGYYQCQILISPSNRVAAEVELQVRRPPFISDNSTRSIVVSEGEAVQMECYAGGYPPPRISWRRENNAILPTGGSIYRGNILKIKQIRKEDRGTYYCVAENGVGRGTKRKKI
ncbi:Lachesin, partial [Gonioctena quinquepunctata]